MKEHSGKRIGQDGRKCAHRAGLARCVGRRLAEGGAAAERGRAWRLAGAGASGCDRIGKAFTLSDGIANVRRPSPLLAHSPVPHSASFLFPSARRGVKSALFGSSCCGGKKEESKKRGEIPSHLFLSSRTAGEQSSKTALEQHGNAAFHSKPYGRTNALRLVQIISGDVVFQEVRLRDKRGFQMIAFVFQYSEFEIQKLGRHI